MERDYNLEKRKYVIGASVIVIVLIYLIRLFTLQIMSEDYKKNADSNAFLNKTQYPPVFIISFIGNRTNKCNDYPCKL